MNRLAGTSPRTKSLNLQARRSRPGGETFGLGGPRLADEPIWHEAFEGLEPASEVVGGSEVGEMLAELVVALVVALDGGVLNSPIHSFDLALPWITTAKGGQWFVIFRLYTPDKPFFDKSWKLPDIEKVA